MKAVSVEQQQKHYSNPSVIDRWAKRLVLRWLEKITVGHLRLNEAGKYYEFGETASVATLNAHIVIHNPMVYRDILLNGTVGAGEAYMRGAWSSPDIVQTIRVMCANMPMLNSINEGWSSLNKLLGSIAHRLKANNKSNARLNIAAHYDLGNDFFKLFLDKTMMYSSAIFPTDDATLYDASVYKLAHICERLQLSSSDHLLEIGTGWGGMAIYAARHYGCRVTTTTISNEQYLYTCEQVKQAGLDGLVTVLKKDYRDLLPSSPDSEGLFDKLVSIEMIEAVGHQYYKDYFRTCTQLLKPDGLMLIQAITVPDQRYELTRNSSDFIQRYIFPGGELPSLTTITQHVTIHTDMQVVSVDDITAHYAKTLSLWRDNFFSRLEQVKAQGFNAVFIRMWDFYLSYCQGGFEERTISTVQLLMARPKCRALPVVKH